LTALGKPDDAIKTLADDAWGAFASQAHEVRGDAFYAKHDIQDAVKEYQAALGAGDAGRADSGLLQLKLADLSAPLSAAPPTADPSSKAKP
jgi:predicted negative regulator of RcsB-dependent stress response